MKIYSYRGSSKQKDSPDLRPIARESVLQNFILPAG